jgi:hypothetical protein
MSRALDHPGKARIVHGMPRSLTDTKGVVMLSRCRHRSARSSSPSKGCVLGSCF